MLHTETSLTANKRSFLKLASLSALLFSVALLSGCKDEKAPTTTGGGSTPATAIVGDKIIIGEYGSMTGAQADFGIQTDNGIRLAKPFRHGRWRQLSIQVRCAEGRFCYAASGLL